MQAKKAITTLFLDIGGVLLSDGWDRYARQRAAIAFTLDLAEMETRHHLIFESYETGKLSLDHYLALVVFYRQRPFSRAQFRRFMFAQSTSCPEMIELVGWLKRWYGLKIVAVSNEAREINRYRVRKFKLDGLVDTFITSSFVHIRKPEADIFRLALDVAQVKGDQVVFIENTPMFVEIAAGLGIHTILHTDYASTCMQLAGFGLQHDQRAAPGRIAVQDQVGGAVCLAAA